MSQKAIFPHLQFVRNAVSSHFFTAQFPPLMFPFQMKQDKKAHIYKNSGSNRFRDKKPYLLLSECFHSANTWNKVNVNNSNSPSLLFLSSLEWFYLVDKINLCPKYSSNLYQNSAYFLLYTNCNIKLRKKIKSPAQKKHQQVEYF